MPSAICWWLNGADHPYSPRDLATTLGDRGERLSLPVFRPVSRWSDASIKCEER